MDPEAPPIITYTEEPHLEEQSFGLEIRWDDQEHTFTNVIAAEHGLDIQTSSANPVTINGDDIATQAYVLSQLSNFTPVISGYAELSAANTFISTNKFTSNVTISGSTTSMIFDKANLQLNAQIGVMTGAHIYFNNANTFLWKSNATSAPLQIQTNGGINLVATSAYPIKIAASSTGAYIQFRDSFSSCTLSEIALKTEIPTSLPANGGMASSINGYASEIWTFTLSGGSTVSKTILVG